jgi:hypothetical protein
MVFVRWFCLCDGFACAMVLLVRWFCFRLYDGFLCGSPLLWFSSVSESTIDSTRLVPGPINKIHNPRHCDAKGQQKSKRTWLCHDSAGIPTRVRRSVVDGKRLTLLNRVIRYAIV